MEKMMARSRHIATLILPRFNALATLAFIDPFRAANYLSARPLYSWRFLSLDAAPVVASNGVTLSDTMPFDDVVDEFDFVAVSASWTPEAYCNARLFRWLRRCSWRGAALGGIDTGAAVLASGALLDGYRSTVHYEYTAAFRELFPQLEVSDHLFVIDRDRFFSSGGAASADMALEMIRREHGIELSTASARYIYHDRIRPPSEKQHPLLREPIGSSVPLKIRAAILLMEGNLEEPVPVPVICDRVGMSQRHMERLFRMTTGVSPLHYYLDLRLDRARGLVTQTEMSILAISIASGFATPGQFARAYKQRFEHTPTEDRFVGRIPFQFRSFPGHATQFNAGDIAQRQAASGEVSPRAAAFGTHRTQNL
jgi:transcriptional regulator GlxA family with amidase domain